MAECFRENTERSEFLSEWGEKALSEYEGRREYLIGPPKWSDLWIKRKLLSSRNGEVDVLKAKGANMEIYGVKEDDLYGFLKRELMPDGENFDPSLDEKIGGFASYIARRYIFKLGNTQDYIVDFGGSVMVLPRDHMEQGFGPLGYPIKNRRKRVMKNAREVTRLGIYLGREDEVSISGAFVCGEIRRFAQNPKIYSPASVSGFFVQDDEGDNSFRVNTLYAHDKHPNYDPLRHSEPDYLRTNIACRDADDIEAFEDDLRPFCDALVTVGVHDTVRRLIGYNKHTPLTYEQVLEIVTRLNKKYRRETFLLPEHTTYGYDPRMSSFEWETQIADNDKATDVFLECFERILPEKVKHLFADEKVRKMFARKAMEHWHEVPDYEVDSATSILSSAMAKFVLKAIYLYVVKPDSEKRTDFEKDPLLAEFFDVLSNDERSTVHGATIASLCYYYFNAKGGKCPVFKRCEKTQLKTQERLDYGGENLEVLEGPIPISEIVNGRQDILEAYPEVAEKLVAYFYQLYRFYRHTGSFVDMRPNNVVKYVFGLGEWALQTDNTQIVVFKNSNTGEIVSKVINIDPEDQFRRTPRNDAERDPREGLATYGLNMDTVAERSLKKALLRFVDAVAKNEKISGGKEDWSLLRCATQYISDVFRETRDSSMEATGFTVRSVAQEARREIGDVYNLLKQAFRLGGSSPSL